MFDLEKTGITSLSLELCLQLEIAPYITIACKGQKSEEWEEDMLCHIRITSDCFEMIGDGLEYTRCLKLNHSDVYGCCLDMVFDLLQSLGKNELYKDLKKEIALCGLFYKKSFYPAMTAAEERFVTWKSQLELETLEGRKIKAELPGTERIKLCKENGEEQIFSFIVNETEEAQQVYDWGFPSFPNLPKVVNGSEHTFEELIKSCVVCDAYLRKEEF